MKTRSIIIGAAIIFSITSCVSRSDYNKLNSENGVLKTENSTLKKELEECQNGASKLIAKIQQAYSEKNYALATKDIELLKEKHPESPKNKDFAILLKKIKKEVLIEKKKKEEKERERIRLKNLHNTGMWVIRHFVDKFGEKTKEKYITNKSSIYGTFSNSATQNSNLRVDLMISKAYNFKENGYDIAIQMYEYAGNNPIKDGGSYEVFVQGKNGKRYSLSGSNYNSDRLTISSYSFNYKKPDNKILNEVLLKGGKIRFVIKEDNEYGTSSEYHFVINNADWYEHALQLLNEKE